MLDLFEFETTPEGGSDSGATPVAEPAAPSGEVGAEEAESAGTVTPSAWSPDDPAFVQAVDDRAAEQAEAIIQARLAELFGGQIEEGYDPAQQAAVMPEYDPFDPESAQAYF